MNPLGEQRDVHLLQLPVPLAARARQHFEGLMREFALIAAGSSDGEPEHEIPVRLTQLVDALTGQFADINTAADERLEAAMEQQLEVIEDHVLVLPTEAGPASEVLGAMLDEADAYCQQGKHLLTLATPPECVAYRRWYLGQVVSQLGGAPPIAWPDCEQARSL